MDIGIHIQQVARNLSKRSCVVGVQSPKVARLSENRALIKIRVIFFDGSYLDFKENTDTAKSYPQYVRYQYQYSDAHGVQIFRYDDAPHHRAVETFPHHKHIGPSDEIIVPSERPSHSKVFKEINQHLGVEDIFAAS